MNIPLIIFLLWMSQDFPQPPHLDTDKQGGWYVYYQTLDPRKSYGAQVSDFYDMAVIISNENPKLDRNVIWRYAMDHMIHDNPSINICED